MVLRLGYLDGIPKGVLRAGISVFYPSLHAGFISKKGSTIITGGIKILINELKHGFLILR
jgi:hypothetical protein